MRAVTAPPRAHRGGAFWRRPWQARGARPRHQHPSSECCIRQFVGAARRVGRACLLCAPTFGGGERQGWAAVLDSTSRLKLMADPGLQGRATTTGSAGIATWCAIGDGCTGGSVDRRRPGFWATGEWAVCLLVCWLQSFICHGGLEVETCKL